MSPRSRPASRAADDAGGIRRDDGPRPPAVVQERHDRLAVPGEHCRRRPRDRDWSSLRAATLFQSPQNTTCSTAGWPHHSAHERLGLRGARLRVGGRDRSWSRSCGSAGRSRPACRAPRHSRRCGCAGSGRRARRRTRRPGRSAPAARRRGSARQRRAAPARGRARRPRSAPGRPVNTSVIHSLKTSCAPGSMACTRRYMSSTIPGPSRSMNHCVKTFSVSLVTSQMWMRPRYRPTTVSTCRRIRPRAPRARPATGSGFGKRSRSQFGTPLPVENGGALPHSSVCPFTWNPCLAAQANSASAVSKKTLPGSGSTSRHLRLVSATMSVVWSRAMRP